MNDGVALMIEIGRFAGGSVLSGEVIHVSVQCPHRQCHNVEFGLGWLSDILNCVSWWLWKKLGALASVHVNHARFLFSSLTQKSYCFRGK